MYKEDLEVEHEQRHVDYFTEQEERLAEIEADDE